MDVMEVELLKFQLYSNNEIRWKYNTHILRTIFIYVVITAE